MDLFYDERDDATHEARGSRVRGQGSGVRGQGSGRQLRRHRARGGVQGGGQLAARRRFPRAAELFDR